MRGLIAILWFGFLSGCSKVDDSEVLTVLAAKGPLQIAVPAKGEVVAANSTVMSVPSSSRGPQTLAWLLPENSTVKAGDVIARFDGESYMTERDSTRLDLNTANLETENKSQMIASEKADINSDTKMVKREIGFSDKFNIDDLTVYSKNDIIDALDNREYLAAQQDFLHWKLGNFSISSTSEMELMQLKANQFQTKLQQFETALSNLEVYAPHDGVLVYETNWRGEKPRVGKSMWPGAKLARLPDLSTLEAKLHVLESEAGNVQLGAKVEIRLDAAPDKVFSGRVEQKAGIAKSIKAGDPVKYFEVTVLIENPDPVLVKPGNKVVATILGDHRRGVLKLPLQAVFSDDKGSYVYTRMNGKMVKADVVLGLKTFAEVEILSGIEPGQAVALFKPVIM